MANGQTLINWAKQKIGIPYKSGGTTDSGYDCSGFTQAAYRSQGVSIPRSAQEQYYSASQRVSRENLQIGDLVFFKNTANNGRYITHVGIYVGGGNFIHSPRTGKSIEITSLDSNYYNSHFAGGGRYNGLNTLKDAGDITAYNPGNAAATGNFGVGGSANSALSKVVSFVFVLLLVMLAAWLFLLAFDIKIF